MYVHISSIINFQLGLMKHIVLLNQGKEYFCSGDYMHKYKSDKIKVCNADFCCTVRCIISYRTRTLQNFRELDL